MQHIYNILKFIPYKKYEYKEVAKHFITKSQKLSDFKVLRKDLENNEIRKNLVMNLVNRLKINRKRYINKISSKRN
jgi:hypothetical protein